MCSRHSEPGAGDASVTYRVPLRSLDSDHTTARFIRVYGPRDLSNQLHELMLEHAGRYRVGTPREVSE